MARLMSPTVGVVIKSRAHVVASVFEPDSLISLGRSVQFDRRLLHTLNNSFEGSVCDGLKSVNKVGDN